MISNQKKKFPRGLNLNSRRLNTFIRVVYRRNVLVSEVIMYITNSNSTLLLIELEIELEIYHLSQFFSTSDIK